ncbi:TPA: HEAT repeat domain-containing protein [Providencia rettgeri]
MDKIIINTLVELTHRGNDDIKLAAIRALGKYKRTIEQQDAINRVIELCQSPNKDIAITAIQALSKLSDYFSVDLK